MMHLFLKLSSKCQNEKKTCYLLYNYIVVGTFNGLRIYMHEFFVPSIAGTGLTRKVQNLEYCTCIYSNIKLHVICEDLICGVNCVLKTSLLLAQEVLQANHIFTIISQV